MSLVLAGVPGAVPERHGDDRGGADLSVRLVASPRVAQPGQPLTYRAEVRNAGPGDAVLPVLTVRLPDGVKILGVNVAECHPGSTANEVICASPHDVLAEGTGGVTINGMVRPDARGPLRASATLFSEVVDENEANNSIHTLTSVNEGADLAVRLSRPSRDGQMITMGAVVRNRGPERVRDAAVFFDTGKARFLTAQGAQCRSQSGYIGCELPAVDSGKRVSLRLALHSRGRGPQAEATVYSTQVGDRHPANNMARINLR